MTRKLINETWQWTILLFFNFFFSVYHFVHSIDVVDMVASKSEMFFEADDKDEVNYFNNTTRHQYTVANALKSYFGT